jgi:hypothetical protein
MRRLSILLKNLQKRQGRKEYCSDYDKGGIIIQKISGKGAIGCSCFASLEKDMNLPFGIPGVRDFGKRKEENPEAAAQYRQKLAEYRETLDNYRKMISEYSGKLEGYDRHSVESQLSKVQYALDLTYIKEQGDKMLELLEAMNKGPANKTLTELEGLITSLVDTNYKLEGLDKNVVNRISELMVELQKQTAFQNKQFQTELSADMELLSRRVRKTNALLWFIFIFSLIGISGIAFIILYILEIIPF